jgi:phosphohistidine phosphatase
MKTLLLLRHAKSSWKNPGLADINRPLNNRGKQDAPRIGRLLREEDLLPDLVLSSPAVRAQKTTQAVTNESGYPGEIVIQDDFYPGDPTTYIESLNSLPDQFERVMIVGHNPGLEEFLDTLTNESARLKTSSLAQISLPIESWLELEDESIGTLVNLWRVKELG